MRYITGSNHCRRHQDQGVHPDEPPAEGARAQGRGLHADRIRGDVQIPGQGEGGGGPLVPQGLQSPGGDYSTHLLYTVHKTGFVL